MLHRDGTKYSEGLLSQSASEPRYPSFVEARVDEILYTDDPRNSTHSSGNREIEYNCTIINGTLEGQRIFNVKDTAESGGQYNKSVRVRSPTRKGKIEPPITEPDKTDGEFVLIALVYNNPYKSRIIRGLPHPLSRAMDIEKDEGAVNTWEYNGVTFHIDKDGALEIGYGGGAKDVNGNAADENAAGSSIILNKEGGVVFTDSEGQILELDSENKKISIESSADTDMSVGKDWSVEINGNTSIQSNGILTLKGANVLIQSGGVGAARIGDMAIGIGNMGGPVVSTIHTGSITTLIGG